MMLTLDTNMYKYVEDWVIKIIFIKSQEKNSDIMMKNLNGKLYHTHVSKLIASPRHFYMKPWNQAKHLM